MDTRNRHRLTALTVLLTLSTIADAACAQAVVERRIETQIIVAPPVAEGARFGESYTVPARPAGPLPPGTQVNEVERELVTLAFFIPDFNPADLATHSYHVGMFADGASISGTGSGTVFPDDAGYVEFETEARQRADEWQHFLYAYDVATGDVQMFIDIADLTVSAAVRMLNLVSMNVRAGVFGDVREWSQRNRLHQRDQLPVAGERRLSLFGDYLGFEDLQEQVFRQTRCHIENDDGAFYVAACQ